MLNHRQLLAALILILTLAAPAAAQESPTKDAYSGTQVEIEELLAAPTPEPTPEPEATATPEPETIVSENPEQGGMEQEVASRKGNKRQRESGAQRQAKTPSVSAGTLPFTGMEVGVVIGLGALLVLTGVLMRRASSRQ